jgi:hypothetical protein
MGVRGGKRIGLGGNVSEVTQAEEAVLVWVDWGFVKMGSFHIAFCLSLSLFLGHKPIWTYAEITV